MCISGATLLVRAFTCTHIVKRRVHTVFTIKSTHMCSSFLPVNNCIHCMHTCIQCIRIHILVHVYTCMYPVHITRERIGKTSAMLARVILASMNHTTVDHNSTIDAHALKENLAKKWAQVFVHSRLRTSVKYHCILLAYHCIPLHTIVCVLVCKSSKITRQGKHEVFYMEQIAVHV